MDECLYLCKFRIQDFGTAYEVQARVLLAFAWLCKCLGIRDIGGSSAQQFADAIAHTRCSCRCRLLTRGEGRDVVQDPSRCAAYACCFVLFVFLGTHSWRTCMTLSRMTSLIGTGFRVERRASETAVGDVGLEWAAGLCLLVSCQRYRWPGVTCSESGGDDSGRFLWGCLSRQNCCFCALLLDVRICNEICATRVCPLLAV